MRSDHRDNFGRVAQYHTYTIFVRQPSENPLIRTLLLLLLGITLSCNGDTNPARNGDPSSSATALASDGATAPRLRRDSSTAAPATPPNRSEAEIPAPGTSRVNERAKLRGLPKDSASTAPKIVLRVGEATAHTGEEACIPVTVKGFNNLIGFQYTMAYDSSALAFKRIQKHGLPGYGKDNFGTRFADRGVVSTLWTDLSLKGTTRPAGHTLYEICFENLMPRGAQTPVRLQDGPTSFEVVRSDMQTLRIVWADGAIYSR